MKLVFKDLQIGDVLDSGVAKYIIVGIEDNTVLLINFYTYYASGLPVPKWLSIYELWDYNFKKLK